jgi:hypothetical protein
VSDDVVQLARDPRAFLCNGSSRTFLALPLGPRGAVLGFVGFLELSSQHEADEPNDGEDEGDKDEVADAALRVRSRDDSLDPDDQSKSRDGLPPVAE